MYKALPFNEYIVQLNKQVVIATYGYSIYPICNYTYT